MVHDFELLADAGAIVVTGSQAHTPKLMAFYNDTFLHFGLGNLFFDQMDMLETRQEFIDRLIFYDGKLVSVELLTAMLEEYARPRPMVESERETFLTRIFSAAINFLE
jgi:poly-gamma-glutamate synthesis protein (capsule biosynthesis protein)